MKRTKTSDKSVRQLSRWYGYRKTQKRILFYDTKGNYQTWRAKTPERDTELHVLEHSRGVRETKKVKTKREVREVTYQGFMKVRYHPKMKLTGRPTEEQELILSSRRDKDWLWLNQRHGMFPDQEKIIKLTGKRETRASKIRKLVQKHGSDAVMSSIEEVRPRDISPKAW